jgi:steroid delta-isomerase-like uncharacterized protein
VSATENKAIVRRFMEEILNANRLDLVDELFAPNYVNHLIPPGAPQGPEGERNFIGMFHAGFPDYRMALEEMVAEDDRVATAWTFHGTHTGAFVGIPPTGRAVTMTGMNIFRLAGGQIVDNRSNYDQMGLLQQLGVVPAPEPAGAH